MDLNLQIVSVIKTYSLFSDLSCLYLFVCFVQAYLEPEYEFTVIVCSHYRAICTEEPRGMGGFCLLFWGSPFPTGKCSITYVEMNDLFSYSISSPK